jgi:hypothetical protein
MYWLSVLYWCPGRTLHFPVHMSGTDAVTPHSPEEKKTKGITPCPLRKNMRQFGVARVPDAFFATPCHINNE